MQLLFAKAVQSIPEDEIEMFFRPCRSGLC